MISSSFDRPERTPSTASDARNRYKMRITTARMDASHLVNTYAQVSGTHRVSHGDVSHGESWYIERKSDTPTTHRPLPKKASDQG